MPESIVATAAPSFVGAYVAALGAIELSKLLGVPPGDPLPDNALASRELYCDARFHNQYLAKLPRSAMCIFDHCTIETLEPIDDRPLEALLSRTGFLGVAAELKVEGQSFLRGIGCTDCGAHYELYALRDRLSTAALRCSRCSQVMHPSVLEHFDGLAIAELPPSLRDQSLRDRGLVAGDVFSIRSQRGRRYFVLTPDPGVVGRVRCVVHAGLGNIGSHSIGHTARMARGCGIDLVVLADPDVYTVANITGQEIRRSDVGRFKVDVSAERIHDIDPDLSVVAHRGVFESLPRGVLRGAVVLGGVDSRIARQRIAEACWRMNSWFVDMAVDAEGLLARISTYVPGEDTPCLECGWGPGDYAALEQTLPCLKPDGDPPEA